VTYLEALRGLLKKQLADPKTTEADINYTKECITKQEKNENNKG